MIPANGTPSASRTHDLPLGGACYIHLTMGACAILCIFYTNLGQDYLILKRVYYIHLTMMKFGSKQVFQKGFYAGTISSIAENLIFVNPFR